MACYGQGFLYKDAIYCILNKTQAQQCAQINSANIRSGFGRSDKHEAAWCINSPQGWLVHR